jgi:hypothetical protein
MQYIAPEYYLLDTFFPLPEDLPLGFLVAFPLPLVFFPLLGK